METFVFESSKISVWSYSCCYSKKNCTVNEFKFDWILEFIHHAQVLTFFIKCPWNIPFSLRRLMNTENNLLQTREEDGGSFERTLVASEFIDWLLQEGEMPSREEAEQLGRRLLEHGIIQHGEVSADTVWSAEMKSKSSAFTWIGQTS